MPAPSRKTPQKSKRLLALHRSGASAREIADDLKVTHRTVLQWLEQAGLTPNGGHGKRAERKRAPKTETVQLAAAAELAEPLPDGTGSDARAVVEARLRAVRKMIDSLEGLVHAGEYSAASYGGLVRLEGDLAARVQELTPPVPPDPELDPANQMAAAQARARLERLIVTAEKSARCAHCGRPPFGAK